MANPTKQCGHCGNAFARDVRCTWAHWGRAKYCSRGCAGAAIAAQKVSVRPTRTEAFAKWFEKTDGCWLWTGAIDRDGYGIFSYAGETRRAARVALELDGRDPTGLFACHTCDNPACVRPSHLFLGSNTDNMRDMVAKGRNPDRHGPNNPNWKGGSRRRAA